MNWKMSDKSLFALLLRSPWWISIAVFAGFALLARALLPPAYVWAGLFGGLPFLVIGVIAARRQWLAPKPALLAQQMELARAMAWRDFAQALTEAYTWQGYVVIPFAGAGADLQLIKAGRTTLVSCKRWKAAKLGVEVLRELVAARQRQDASLCACITLGQLSDTARAYAKAEGVQVIEAAELATLMLK
ncbi:MAG: restriction endonuclease [Betaproteobacteria bacterium]